jgi:tetratricopeptide (TPR) repeat protein
MKRGSLAPLLCLALATVSVPVLAQPTGSSSHSTSVSAEDQAKAQRHFQRAKELYFAGNYRDAVTELEVAHKLDPKAKDLVMNLGIVSEKLAKYDDALAYFKTYVEMEGVTAAERTKAETSMKRIEGAKRELPAQPPPASSSSSTKTTPPPPSQPQDEPPRHGRIDALTIGFSVVAAVGLVAGAGIGVYALTSKPSDFVTGRDGTYQQLQEKTDNAHTMAIIADVSLGVGVAAAAAAAGLYFGRMKDSTTATTKMPHVSAAPLPSGGAVFVGGTF